MEEVLNINEWIQTINNPAQFKIYRRNRYTFAVERLNDGLIFIEEDEVLLNLANMNCNCKIVSFNDDNINVSLCLSRGECNHYIKAEINKLKLNITEPSK